MTWDQIERKWDDMARRVQTQWDQRGPAEGGSKAPTVVPQQNYTQAQHRQAN